MVVARSETSLLAGQCTTPSTVRNADSAGSLLFEGQCEDEKPGMLRRALDGRKNKRKFKV